MVNEQRCAYCDGWVETSDMGYKSETFHVYLLDGEERGGNEHPDTGCTNPQMVSP